MDEKQLKIITLKAELFDLQFQLAVVKKRLDDKLQELNTQLKEGANGSRDNNV